MKTARTLVIGIAILIAMSGAQAQSPWQRLDMDHGGVVEDLQLIVRDDQGGTEPRNVVWSADMGNAFFRAQWYDGQPMQDNWSTWTEYLPGKKGYGVDAIEVAGTEHVYLATGGMGMFYANSTTGTFPVDWARPIDPQHFPPVWKWSALQDVAFYWPDEGTPSAPQTQFYILGNAAGFNNGVYRWYIPPEQFGFIRVDPPYQPSGQYHNYSHFYRDVNTKNVLYVKRGVKYDVEGVPEESGGLFKLTCPAQYGQPELFDDLTSSLIPSGSLSNYLSVLGFSQWKASTSVVYYYLYVMIHNATQTPSDKYQVFVSNSLADPNNITWNQIYDCSNLMTSITPDPNLDWVNLLNDTYDGAGVIGRPDGENHHLWLTNSTYGVWYVHAPDQAGSPVQINGLDANGVPALKRWAVRAFTMESQDHIGQTELMRLFFGTHQMGVWYLKFSDLNLSLDN